MCPCCLRMSPVNKIRVNTLRMGHAVQSPSAIASSATTLRLTFDVQRVLCKAVAGAQHLLDHS
jgi:hypothetical protein